MANIVLLPIQSAPFGREVLLTGSSGYNAPHDTFIINGYRVHDWHGGAFNDATGTPLSDNGWTPKYWAEKPQLPEGISL